MQLTKAFLVLLLVLPQGCNKPTPTPSSPAPPEKAQSEKLPTAPAPKKAAIKPPGKALNNTPGTAIQLRILTAPSLANSLHELARTYSEDNPDGVTISVRESNIYEALKRLGSDGGDILVSEGYAAMEVAKAASFIGSHIPRTVTHLPLTVTVRGEKSSTLRSINDLSKEDVRLGAASPQQSTGGRAARRLLRKAGFSQNTQIITLPGSVKNALHDGVVDAFIGWGRLGGTGVPINLPAAYRELLPIPAVVSHLSKQVEAAETFVSWLTSDTAKEIWQAANTLPTPYPGASVIPTILPASLPSPRRYSGSVVVGSRILLVGGQLSNKPLKDICWYTPSKVTTSKAGVELPFPRSAPAVVHLASKKQVFIAGGEGVAGPTVDMYRYDPKTNQVDLLAQELPLPVSNAASILNDGSMFLFGGKGTANTLLDTVVQLNLNTGSSQRLPVRFPVAFKDMAAAHGVNGRILLAGGFGSNGPNNEIWDFDPESGEIKRLPAKLTQQLSELGLVPWKDGWLTIGGLGTKGAQAAIQLIKIQGGTTTLSHRLPYPVQGASVIRFSEHVYVLGGISDRQVESRIIRYPY
ncbi:MAG TPA: hypothetical protein EYN06_06650 [Myxococcales bacterium]|nr:hypothetical protein [Myxococcales bacterium]HIN86142.1 hypothetical protein [Myxococcales bacterium]